MTAAPSARLAQSLGELGFTGVTFDRRGRGDSGDTQPYAVQREVEDIASVIEAAGETALPPSFSASPQAVRSSSRPLRPALPMTKAAAIEVPYRSGAWPPAPDDYIGTLERFEAAGDREGILRYFNDVVVGMPAEMVDGMVGSPMWEPMLAMTYTVKYDGLCLGGDDQSLPTGRWQGHVPFLSVCSSGTAMPWLHDSAGVLADALPDGRASSCRASSTRFPPPCWLRRSPSSSAPDSTTRPVPLRRKGTGRHTDDQSASMASTGLCSGGTTSRGGSGGVPSPKGEPPSDSRPCGVAQLSRAGPSGTMPVGFTSVCTT